MSSTRYIGSGRPIEGGFLATHKQDFRVHVDGTDFRHTADQIDMNPPITAQNNVFNSADVQGTLELMATAFASAGQGFITIGDGYDRGDFNVGDPGVPTLNAAFSFAFATQRLQNGGIVLVKAGTYTLDQTVIVPPGMTIMGEPTGTNIIGEMGETPMFLFEKSDRFVNTGVGTSNQSTDQSKLWNICLFDNLYGNVAGGNPSMTSVPMVQCQRGSNVVFERVTMIGRALSTSLITHRGIGYTGPSPGVATTLSVESCYFDAVKTAVDFDLSDGAINTLKVINTRAQTFGDGGAGTADNRAFVAFGNCCAHFANNHHIGQFATWGASSCYYIKDIAVGDTNTSLTLIGNTGGLTGAGIDTENTLNFIVDGRAIKTAMKIVNLSNAWGTSIDNQAFCTVGDGILSVGDINGINALDIAIQRYNSTTYDFLQTGITTVYILPGTYNVTNAINTPQIRLKLVGVSNFSAIPIVNLNITTAPADADNIKFLGVEACENIDFRGVGIAPQGIKVPLKAGPSFYTRNITFKNCRFYNVFVNTSVQGVIDYTTVDFYGCVFIQTGAYADLVSLRIPTTNLITIKKCRFLGRGYALNIDGGNISNSVTVEDCFFDQYWNTSLTPVAGNKISTIPASLSAIAYIAIRTNQNERLIFKDNYVRGYFSSTNSDTPINPAIAVDTSFVQYIMMNAKNIFIDNCRIFGAGQLTNIFGTNYPMPTVLAAPVGSLKVTNSTFVGALPFQVTDVSASANQQAYEYINTPALYDDTEYSNELIIDGCEFLGYQAVIPNVTNTCLDLDIPEYLFSGAGTADRKPVVIVSNSRFDNGETTTTNTKALKKNNTSVTDLSICGGVQVFCKGWDLSFTNNDSSIKLSSTQQTAGDVLCGAAIKADTSLSRYVTQNVNGSKFNFVNGLASGIAGQYSVSAYFYGVDFCSVKNSSFRIDAIGNDGIVNSGNLAVIQKSGSNSLLISGNSFTRSGSAIPNGAVYLTKQSGTSLRDGSVTGNSFSNSSLSNTNSALIDLINVVAGNYYIAQNVNQVFTHTDRYHQLSLTSSNNILPIINGALSIPSGWASAVFGVDSTQSVTFQVSNNVQIPNPQYKIDLGSVLPKGSTLVSASATYVVITPASWSPAATIIMDLNRFDLASDVNIATQTKNIASGSSSVGVGSLSSPINQIVDDLFINLRMNLQTTGGAGQFRLGALTIRYKF